MNIAKIIEGTAELTLQWNQKEHVSNDQGEEREALLRREHFKKFAIDKWKQLGKDDSYIYHMVSQYIDTDEPIFCQIYNLDHENRRIVLEYLDWYMHGIGLPDDF
jgi:hypothetical protein